MELFVILSLPGIWSTLLIVVVVLLVFGGKKIPELMRGIGSGINEFKKGLAGDDKEEPKKNKEE
jgi:sec-independent protein translocase protein TatA